MFWRFFFHKEWIVSEWITKQFEGRPRLHRSVKHTDLECRDDGILGAEGDQRGRGQGPVGVNPEIQRHLQTSMRQELTKYIPKEILTKLQCIFLPPVPSPVSLEKPSWEKGCFFRHRRTHSCMFGQTWSNFSLGPYWHLKTILRGVARYWPHIAVTRLLFLEIWKCWINDDDNFGSNIYDCPASMTSYAKQKIV